MEGDIVAFPEKRWKIHVVNAVCILPEGPGMGQDLHVHGLGDLYDLPADVSGSYDAEHLIVDLHMAYLEIFCEIVMAASGQHLHLELHG